MIAGGRGSGRTRAQMERLPQGAVFVWCDGRLDYPKRLAESIGRTDLRIVSPGWISGDMHRGRRITGIAIDHAMSRDKKYIEFWRKVPDVLSLVRPQT